MHCKQVQISLSMGDALPENEREHLRDCARCSDYAKLIESIDHRVGEVRASAPVHLRSAITQRVSSPHPSARLRPAFGNLAVAAVIAIPLALFVGSRLSAKHRAVSGKIGEWPTYHAVRRMYPNGIKGRPEYNVQETWVTANAVRSTQTSGSRMIEDFIVKEESGLPVKYSRSSDGSLKRVPDGNGYMFTPGGKVKREPAASTSFSPFSDDLRWEVDIPRNFGKIKSKTEGVGVGVWLLQPDGSTVPVTTTTVTSGSGEAKVVEYKEPTSGKILLVEHYTTVYDSKGKIFLKLLEDYSMRFDYASSKAGRFDPASLATPASTTQAIRG